MNVLAKILIPRIVSSIRYILSELEEMEREEIFRLKRVKQNKMKKASIVKEIGGGDKTQIIDEPSPTKIEQVTNKTEGETDAVPLNSAAEGDPMVVIKLPESDETADDVMLLEHIETMKNVDELIKTVKEEKEDGLEQLDEKMSEVSEEKYNTEQLRNVDGLSKDVKEVEKESSEVPVEEKLKETEEIPDTRLLELLKRPSVLPMPLKSVDQVSDMEKEDEFAEVVSKTSESSLGGRVDQTYETTEDSTIPETFLDQAFEIVEDRTIAETPFDEAHETAEDNTTTETPLDQGHETAENIKISEIPLEQAYEIAEETTISVSSIHQIYETAEDKMTSEIPLDQAQEIAEEILTSKTSLEQAYKIAEDISIPGSHLDQVTTPETLLDQAHETVEKITISETPLEQAYEIAEETIIPKKPLDQAHKIAENTSIPQMPLDQKFSKEFEIAEVTPDVAEKQEEYIGESLDKEDIMAFDKDKSSISSKEGENIRETSRESVHKKELSAEIQEHTSLDTTTPSDFSSNVEIGESKSGAVIKSSLISEKDIIDTTPDVIKPKPSVRIKLPIDSKHSVERVISKTSTENISVIETEISLDRSAEGDSKIDTVTREHRPTKIDETDIAGSVEGISDVEPYFNTETIPAEVFEDIDLGTEYSRSEPTRERGKDSDYPQNTGVERDHVEGTETSAYKSPNEIDLPKDQLADIKNSLTDRSTDLSDRKDDNYEADVELDETDVDVGTSREPHSKDAKDKKKNKQDPDVDKTS